MKQQGAGRRTYQMRERARAADETRLRIMEAVIAQYRQPSGQSQSLTIATVARHADVAPQTIRRLFGDREGLIQASIKHARSMLHRKSEPIRGRTCEQIATRLCDFFEQHGDATIRFYHDSASSAVASQLLEAERAYHRRWCEQAFEHGLLTFDEATRRLRVLQIAGVCDVWMWYVLRREGGLSRDETERALVDLLRPLVRAG